MPEPKNQPHGALSDQVYRQLLAAIKGGDYAGQSRLPSEAEMGLRFRVSRPVLRQALERLRNEGVIASKRGSGSFVVEQHDAALSYDPLSSIPDVQRCLEFRCAVESEAAAMAARKRTEPQLAAIEQAMLAFQAMIVSKESAVDADFAFHASVAQATNNAYFVHTLRALRSHISFSINLIQTLSTRSSATRLAVVTEEHRMILEAIRAADPECARTRMGQHLQAGIDRLFPEASLPMAKTN